LRACTDFPEAGYTPANLRALLASAGLTQQAAANLIGVDGRTVRKWLADIDAPSHRDMPLKAWRKLINGAGLALVARLR
jgi:transcriptional regulator with XRE-family HTH domain